MSEARKPAKRLGIKVLAGLFIAAATVAFSGVAAQATPSDNALILDSANQYRAAIGVAPVSEDSDFDQMAQVRADSMASTGFMQHDMNYWYNNLAGRAISFGEVLAQDRPASGVATAWRNSGAHYPLMVNADYTKVGIGYATNADGHSFAVMILVQPYVAPAALSVPQNVNASYANGSITASWSPSTGSPTSYMTYLYREGELVTSESEVNSSNSHTFSNLEPGKNYTVAVQAYRNTDGATSLLSTASSAVRVPAAAPSAPGIGIISRSSDTLRLTWNSGSDNGSAVTAFKVRTYRNGQQIDERTVSSSYYTYQPQQDGAYSFSVAAVNAIGVGEFTASQSVDYSTPVVLQPVASTPTPVRNLTLSQVGDSVLASWSAPVSNDATGYIVTIFLNGSVLRQLTTSNAAVSTQVPTSGSGQLSFTVAAQNAAGLSIDSSNSFYYANAPVHQNPAPVTSPPASTPVQPPVFQPAPVSTPVHPPVATKPQPAPSTPAKVAQPKIAAPSKVATPRLSALAHGKVIVRWNAAKVKDSKSSKYKVSTYQIRVQIGSKIKTYSAKASARSLTLKALPKKKVVKIWVRSKNSGGWSKYSAVKSIKTKR